MVLHRARLLFLCVLPFAGALSSVAACSEDSTSSGTPGGPDASVNVDGGTGTDSGTGPSGNDASPGSDGSTPSGDPDALCAKYGTNLPAFGGTPHRVQNTPSADAAPLPAGGTIVDGTYDQLSNTSWGNGTGMQGGDLRALLIIEGGAWFYRIEFEGVDDQNFSAGFLTVDPLNKTVSFGDRECGGGGTPAGDELRGYTATADSFTTLYDQLVGVEQKRVVKEIVYKKR